jgi:hypothetical protein
MRGLKRRDLNVCTGCGVVKTRENTYKDSSKSDGLYSRCKECHGKNEKDPLTNEIGNRYSRGIRELRDWYVREKIKKSCGLKSSQINMAMVEEKRAIIQWNRTLNQLKKEVNNGLQEA